MSLRSPSCVRLVDIVALEYLIHVDILLFGAAKALLNVKSSTTIFNNLFASPQLKALVEVDKRSDRKWAAIAIKAFIGLGFALCIAFPIVFAYTRWDTLCLDYEAGFMNVSEIAAITDLEERKATCFEQQLTAQRCKAVFDNFAFAPFIPHLDSNVESCGVTS
jgi:hypothetical protein